MKLIAWSQNLTAEGAAGGVALVAKEELFRPPTCLHPSGLSERTRGLVGAEELGAMKPTALLSTPRAGRSSTSRR